jgi:phosphohistidine phosphatase
VATHLWLLRHGEAVPHGTKPDPERELTEKGERQSRLAGKALGRLGVTFDACYTSPKVRARDTARLAAEALGVDVVEWASVADGFDRDDARELLGLHEGHVLVVGHEPDFSQVVHDYTGARVDFKKGGVAVIALSPPELVVLLRPAELRLIAQPG